MDTLRIVLSADRGFRSQLAVALKSIVENGGEDRFDLFVLHDGMDGPLRTQLESVLDGAASVEWLDARSQATAGALLPDYLPQASLFRLRIGDLLPDHVERVLYLDADVFVRRPLRELWTADIGDCLAGAVRDPIVPWAGAPMGLPWRDVEVAADTPYFNSGVLVIPLDRWRSEQLGRRALELLARRRLRHGDQCALNVVMKGRWAALDPSWNLQGGHLEENSLALVTERGDVLHAAQGDPAIVHFNHSAWGRPWLPGCTHPFGHEWLGLLDTIPWAGWRPDQRGNAQSRVKAGLARRAYWRVVRAGRVLIKGS